MDKIKLQASVRDAHGSNANKKLRREELVPGVLYQRGEETLNIQILEKELNRVIHEAGTSSIVALDIDGKEKQVIIKDFQRHPYKNMFLHVDLLGVNMDETLRVNVPIVLLNRDNVHVQPSVLMQALNELEIESLPADIPAQIEYDVEYMELEQSVYVKDLDVDTEKVTIITDLEELVVSLTEPREEVEEEVEDVDPAAVEVIGEDESEEE